jgi:tetratricopeptide (TPR) repeat protein
MASAENELADLLRQGIAAARAGQREAARNLLMQIVERDERNAVAWLWLSGVVDSLDDRETCLENVLALDPGNQAARKGLDWVRSHKPPAPLPAYEVSAAQSPAVESQEPELVPALQGSSGYSAALPPEPSSGIGLAAGEFDNDYLCPYCGKETEPDDKKCRSCGGKLWQSSTQSRPAPSCWLWAVIAMQLGNGLQQLAGFAFVLWLLFGTLFVKPEASTSNLPRLGIGLAGQGAAFLPPEAMQGTITFGQFTALYFGIRDMPADTANFILYRMPRLAFWLTLLSSSLPLAMAVLLYLRWQPIYWYMVGLALVNLVGVIVLSLSGYGLLLACPAAIAVATVVVLLMMAKDFARSAPHRLLCRPDKDVSTHSAFYMRGREYGRRKMWALAAVNFKCALGNAPGVVAYYLALATAYAKLKQYERAQAVLREAGHIAPDHADVRELSGLIAEESKRYAAV